jgi:subtilisin family serine protease
MSKEFAEQSKKVTSKVEKQPTNTKNFKKVEAKQPSKSAKTEYKENEVIVKFKDSKVNSMALEQEVAGLKLQKKENVGKKGAQLFRLPNGKSVEQAVEQLKKSPDVLYAEPNYKLTASDVNDPYFDYLWGLENTGQSISGSYGTPGIDINVKSAWDITKGSTDVVIAVIDSGIDTSHPDLKYRIFKNKNEIPNNGIDDDNNGYIDDVYGWDFYNNDNTVYDSPSVDEHGTHVAGTIAGHSNNDIGVAGVAPFVKILPIKFLGADGGTVSDAVKAIEYADSMGAKISNNSWGGGNYSYAIYEAIRNSDSLFVAAAGNDGYNNDYYPTYPASFDLDNILSVAAIDNKGQLAYFSNYGITSVDVAAPGVNILSTLPDNNYGFYNGTSMAAPHVTGIAALVHTENRDYSVSELKSAILGNTKELDSVKNYVATGGMVDAGMALGILPDDDVPGMI